MPLFAFSQISIGLNSNLGLSKISKASLVDINFPHSDKINPHSAFSIGAIVLFNSNKRVESLLNMGYGQKNSISIAYSWFPGIEPVQIHTLTKLKELNLDVGLRINIINKTNKLFFDLALGNNYILKVSTKRERYTVRGVEVSELNIKSNPPTAYYVSLPLKLGYKFKNYFSIGAVFEPGLTAIDNSNTKVNMWGLTICYYLPILANKKISE